MEHKSVRTFLIFFFGSLGGTLFHAIFSCHPLCGASGGIYALLGACIIKIKHHLRYKGILRPGLHKQFPVSSFSGRESPVCRSLIKTSMQYHYCYHYARPGYW